MNNEYADPEDVAAIRAALNAPSGGARAEVRDISGIANKPPDGLPRYRLLTGPDDEAFCRRVSEALDLGYRLYGSPALTFNGERVIAAQALLWPSKSPTTD